MGVNGSGSWVSPSVESYKLFDKAGVWRMRKEAILNYGLSLDWQGAI